jgi:hypothetical protein
LTRVVAERRISHRLGKKLVEGAQLRSLPQVELPWITTFNLRWWRHAQEDISKGAKQPRGKAGIPT